MRTRRRRRLLKGGRIPEEDLMERAKMGYF